ncbi:MAG: sulfate adenylyltransferase subunit CysD [Lachnospiraceae bacterium]
MKQLTYLDQLEAEAIYIMRETVAECKNPVMLYSIGKDSSVLLHLALKAFYPEKLPFPCIHIDTTWKFREMIEFRDRRAEELGIKMITYRNEEGVSNNINPFEHGKSYTDIMKTEALKKSLDFYGFDAAICGGRRDEEKSRAKERVISHRNSQHAWNPQSQRPELWKLYNMKMYPGESLRVFPLSNWTEKDIWQYILREQIEIVPLYFAKERPYVVRDGNIICVDDDRMKLLPGEKVETGSIRFRTLGCYPLTGGCKSNATNLEEIIEETLGAVCSERSSRIIDSEEEGSMERRKREGYF